MWCWMCEWGVPMNVAYILHVPRFTKCAFTGGIFMIGCHRGDTFSRHPSPEWTEFINSHCHLVCLANKAMFNLRCGAESISTSRMGQVDQLHRWRDEIPFNFSLNDGILWKNQSLDQLKCTWFASANRFNTYLIRMVWLARLCGHMTWQFFMPITCEFVSTFPRLKCIITWTGLSVNVCTLDNERAKNKFSNDSFYDFTLWPREWFGVSMQTAHWEMRCAQRVAFENWKLVFYPFTNITSSVLFALCPASIAR